MLGVKRVKLSIEGKIVFEFSAVDRENVELKVSSEGQRIVVKLCCDSLSELLTELKGNVECLLSKLKDPSYIPLKIETDL